MYDFLSDGNSNVCSSSHNLGDIRKINEVQKVLSCNDSHGQVVENETVCHSTENVRFYIADFFSEF